MSLSANSVFTSTISSPSKHPVKKHSSIKTAASLIVNPPGTEIKKVVGYKTITEKKKDAFKDSKKYLSNIHYDLPGVPVAGASLGSSTSMSKLT